MKKTTLLANKFSFRHLLCFMFIMSACLIGFSACGDDDEDGNGNAETVYPGIWVAKHVTIIEDGETEDADITPDMDYLVRFTINQDGTFEWYVENEDEITGPITGTYSYNADTKVLTCSNLTGMGKIQVHTWTSSVFKMSFTNNSEVVTYTFGKQ